MPSEIVYPRPNEVVKNAFFAVFASKGAFESGLFIGTPDSVVVVRPPEVPPDADLSEELFDWFGAHVDSECPNPYVTRKVCAVDTSHKIREDFDALPVTPWSSNPPLATTGVDVDTRDVILARRDTTQTPEERTDETDGSSRFSWLDYSGVSLAKVIMVDQSCDPVTSDYIGPLPILQAVRFDGWIAEQQWDSGLEVAKADLRCRNCNVGHVFCPGCGRVNNMCPACHQWCVLSEETIAYFNKNGTHVPEVYMIDSQKSPRWPAVFDGSTWDGSDACESRVGECAGLLGSEVVRDLIEHQIGPLLFVPVHVDCTSTDARTTRRLKELDRVGKALTSRK